MKKKKVCLITGASRGLGRALAQVFAENDYDLILHSKERDISKLAKDFKWDRTFTGGQHVNYTVVKGSLEDANTIADISNLAKEAKGIDVLINNAGIHKAGSFEEVSPVHYMESIMVNTVAPMVLTKRLWESVKEKKGLILFINSIAGKVGAKDEFLYCTTKHALKGFADSIQFDATKVGIKVVSAYLGALKTDMTKHRKDYEQLVEVEEASKFLYDICKNYKSLRVTEVDVCRSIYGH